MAFQLVAQSAPYTVIHVGFLQETTSPVYRFVRTGLQHLFVVLIPMVTLGISASLEIAGILGSLAWYTLETLWSFYSRWNTTNFLLDRQNNLRLPPFSQTGFVNLRELIHHAGNSMNSPNKPFLGMPIRRVELACLVLQVTTRLSGITRD